ncbi:hypothetical protein SAY86_008673 [Trapa natans]|uniref:F-box domain-containing protein n=1 Tax=Trapa natans TaxID=22666 RepID=A0AAN7QET2_TRANT|nr:hypothetical protein SAY86_008673 [Trapa natans]
MDTLLLHAPPSPSPPPLSTANKRPCPSTPHTHTLPTRPSSPLDQIDLLLDTFISLSDSSPHAIDLAFDRLLDSRPSDADQSFLIDQAFRLGSAVLEAAKRSSRRRAAKHNSFAWVLPPDLTIKVFSMLDTQTLCYAAATCSMFKKCAMDPSCYANIDLTTVVPKVNNAVVSTMIQRAGKSLQSLKLGIVPGPAFSTGPCQQLVYTIRNSVDVSTFSWNDKKTRQGKESPILTRTCLSPLSGDGGSTGNLLRRLHLYNIDRMDGASLCMALAACPTLCDLEIVGLHVELRQILTFVGKHCHLMERLFFESSKTARDDSLKSPTCVDLVSSCPEMTSLSLRGFKLHDCKVRTLLKGFRKLRYVDFSTSYSITGNFLRNLGNSACGNVLEVVILRDCMHLKETEVSRFFTALLAGDFKFLRFVDISNREGLASEGDWYTRCCSSTALPLREVALERPNICLIAEFPSESFVEVEQMIDSDLNIELSPSSELNSYTSNSSIFISSSESSYHSDQGSGNEDGRDPNYIVYEESSDEVDILTI